MKNQTKEQIKADAVNEFVSQIIGAFETGFINQNFFTLSQLHNMAKAHIESEFKIPMPNIVDQWGLTTAKKCGHSINN